MPEIDYAFLADFARSKNGSLDALSIGIDVIAVPQVPTSVQMVLAMRLEFNRVHREADHVIEAIVQDPDGGRPVEIVVNAQAAWPEVDPLGDRVKVEILMPLLPSIATAGAHSVELSVDGQPRKAIMFTVVRSEAPGAP